MVELQDAEGRMLEGYELKTGKTVTANAVRTRIGWRGGDNRFAA